MHSLAPRALPATKPAIQSTTQPLRPAEVVTTASKAPSTNTQNIQHSSTLPSGPANCERLAPCLGVMHVPPKADPTLYECLAPYGVEAAISGCPNSMSNGQALKAAVAGVSCLSPTGPNASCYNASVGLIEDIFRLPLPTPTPPNSNVTEAPHGGDLVAADSGAAATYSLGDGARLSGLNASAATVAGCVVEDLVRHFTKNPIPGEIAGAMASTGVAMALSPASALFSLPVMSRALTLATHKIEDPKMRAKVKIAIETVTIGGSIAGGLMAALGTGGFMPLVTIGTALTSSLASKGICEGLKQLCIYLRHAPPVRPQGEVFEL